MIKNHYPDLKLIGPKELAVIEPKIMEGRNPNKPVCALISTEGYAVNYQATSQSFLNDSQTANPDINFSPLTEVQKVSRDEYGYYVIETNRGKFVTKFVEFAAGPYSLKFAHALGYGKEFTILSFSFCSCSSDFFLPSSSSPSSFSLFSYCSWVSDGFSSILPEKS